MTKVSPWLTLTLQLLSAWSAIVAWASRIGAASQEDALIVSHVIEDSKARVEMAAAVRVAVSTGRMPVRASDYRD